MAYGILRDCQTVHHTLGILSAVILGSCRHHIVRAILPPHEYIVPWSIKPNGACRRIRHTVLRRGDALPVDGLQDRGKDTWSTSPQL
jgi:hypothetical protein